MLRFHAFCTYGVAKLSRYKKDAEYEKNISTIRKNKKKVCEPTLDKLLAMSSWQAPIQLYQQGGVWAEA